MFPREYQNIFTRLFCSQRAFCPSPSQCQHHYGSGRGFKRSTLPLQENKVQRLSDTPKVTLLVSDRDRPEPRRPASKATAPPAPRTRRPSPSLRLPSSMEGRVWPEAFPNLSPHHCGQVRLEKPILHHQLTGAFRSQGFLGHAPPPLPKRLVEDGRDDESGRGGRAQP